MTRTRGEGRSQSEKSQRVVEPNAIRRERIKRLQKENEEWQSKNGPVEVRKIDD